MFDYRKLGVASTWIVAIVGAALLARIGSVMAWFVVSVIAVVPCVVMLHFWQDSAQTISQSIQRARR